MNENTAMYFEQFSASFRPYVRQQYAGEIQRFEAWAGIDFMEAQHPDGENYRAYLLQKGRADTTVAKIMHTLSAFGEYLASEIEWTNPFYRVSSGVTFLDYEHMEFPDMKEVESFLLALEREYYPVAMVGRIILATGCKLSELLRINRGDILVSQTNQRIGIIFHNYPPFHLVRTVTIPDYLIPAFSDYLDALPEAASDAPVFYNKRMKRLSTWSCEQVADRTGCNITFSTLKVMATFMFVEAGATNDEIADYCGKTGRWLSRYRVSNTLKPSLLDSKKGVFYE